MKQHNLHHLLAISLAWFACTLAPHQAKANDYAHCSKQYQAQQYRKASACLLALVKQLDAIKSPTKSQKLTKGNTLRSAAIALNKVAQSTKNIGEASYLREQAVGLLLRYEKEKLYRNIRRKKSTQRLRLKIQVALRLTPLSVIGGTANAQLVIKGYKFTAQGKGKWLKSVRPGRYTIVATYPKANNATKTQQLDVAPGKAAFVTFKPPLKRVIPTPSRPNTRAPKPTKPVRPNNGLKLVGWVLLAAGGAAALASIAPFAMLQGANATINEQGKEYENTCSNKATLSDACVTQGNAVRDAHAQGQTLQGITWGLLGGGIAVAAIGAILVAIPTRKTAPPKANDKPEGRTLLRLR